MSRIYRPFEFNRRHEIKDIFHSTHSTTRCIAWPSECCVPNWVALHKQQVKWFAIEPMPMRILQLAMHVAVRDHWPKPQKSPRTLQTVGRLRICNYTVHLEIVSQCVCAEPRNLVLVQFIFQTATSIAAPVQRVWRLELHLPRFFRFCLRRSRPKSGFYSFCCKELMASNWIGLRSYRTWMASENPFEAAHNQSREQNTLRGICLLHLLNERQQNKWTASHRIDHSKVDQLRAMNLFVITS